jgi:transposase
LTDFWNLERVALADFLKKKEKKREREREKNPSQCYIKTLTALKRRIEWIGIRYETLLQHDARPHASAAIRDAIQHLDFSMLPHPLYSPDLAQSDFHLFPKLREHLKGQHFSFDEEVKSAVRKWFQKQNTNGQVWKILPPLGFDLRTIR